MKLDRKALIRALKTTAPIAKQRATIPILHTLLFNPTTDGVEILATDLDLQLRVLMRDAIKADRAFCLARPEALISLLKASDGDDATITVQPTRTEPRTVRRRGDNVQEDVRVGGETLLSCDGLDVDLGRGLSPEDWPRMYTADTIWTAEVGSDFMGKLAAVSLAMSPEETRYYLNGIFFHHVEGWTYRLVATDGHRLIYANIEMPGSPTPDDNGMGKGRDGGIIIPRAAVAALLRIHAADRATPIRFSVLSPRPDNAPADLAANPSASRASFDVGDTCLMTKLIDGTFPDYTRVIPAEGIRVAEVARADLRRVVGALVGYQTERTRAVKLTFDDGALTLSANVVEQGVATMPIPGKLEGKGFSVGFNGRYLLAMCTAIAGETVRISTQDDASPCLVYDPADDGVRTILMPMRI